jgi:hypothetical protein
LKNIVKILTALLTLILAPAFADGAVKQPKARDTVTITTVPPGATVEWNRKVIGVTPLTMKVGEYAFNVRKSTIFSKHLDIPVDLRISLSGFATMTVQVTGNPYLWVSADRRYQYAY